MTREEVIANVYVATKELQKTMDAVIEALQQPTPEEVIRKCALEFAHHFAYCTVCTLDCDVLHKNCNNKIEAYLREKVLK